MHVSMIISFVFPALITLIGTTESQAGIATFIEQKVF